MSSHSFEDYDDQYNKGFRNILILVGCLIAALLVACVATGCLTEKRALKKMNVIAARKPDAALKFCADRFPNKTDTRTDIQYLPGETKYLPGEVRLVDCDTVHEVGKTRIVRVNCPPSSHTTDTVVKTITVTVTNTAKELLLTKERDEYQTNFKKWRKRAYIGWGIITAGLVAGGIKLFLRMKKIV